MNVQALPDDVVWTVLQFLYLPSELYQCMRVSKQWHSIMNDYVMFWKEKVMQSNWLLNSIPPDAHVVSQREYEEALQKEQEEEDRRNNVEKKRKKKHYYIIKRTSQQNMNTLRSFNFLMKQWFNDWISYWTSNFIYSDSEESENEGDGALNNIYVFEMPLRLWECGIAHFPMMPPRIHVHGHTRQFQAQDSIFVDDQRYRYCYEDLILFSLLNQRVQDEQNLITAIYNDDGEEDPILLQEARQKYFSWKDKSTENGSSYPIISFLSFNYHEDEITVDNFCEFIRANKELYSSNDVYTWKSVIMDQRHDQEEQEREQHGEDHPIRAAGDTIQLRDIFPDDSNRPHYDWILSHLHDVKFAVLGSTQLNPVPVFIIGKTVNDNLAGFCSATFRVPHQ